MLTRLGNVLSWTATGLSLLILAFGTWATLTSDRPQGPEVWAFVFAVAAAVYAIGRALRYILAEY